MKQLTETDRPDFSRAVAPGDTALANALMGTFGPSSPVSLRESRTSQQLAKTLGDLDKPEREPTILDHVKACIPFWRDTAWADDMSFVSVLPTP